MRAQNYGKADNSYCRGAACRALGRFKTCPYKTRLPKLVMPSFPYEDDHKGPSERSEAQTSCISASISPPVANGIRQARAYHDR